MLRIRKTFVVSALALLVLVSLVTNAASAVVVDVKPEASPVYRQFLTALSIIRSSYVEDIPLSKLLQGAIYGVMRQLDTYSAYYTTKDLSDLMGDIEGSFGGVGIHIEIKDGWVTVVTPIAGSPADIAGIRSGDRLIEVEGRSAKGWGVDTASSAIRGTPGTHVKLKMERDGKVIEFDIVRAQIQLSSTEVQVADLGDIGIIKISNFSSVAGAEVEGAMMVLKDRGTKGVILDLRGNPGGLMTSALEVLTFFMPEGPAIHVYDRNGNKTSFDSGSKEPVLPMIVLIDGGSASASEVVAGAIRDYGTGTLMGQKSFGKGSVQNIIDLGNDDAMKLTVYHYTTPKDVKIDGVGLTPDEIVPREWPKGLTPVPYIKATGLEMKDSGQSVKDLTTALYTLGFAKKVTDTFDDTVLTAVGKYQLYKGLTPTGKANYETIREINHELLYSGQGGADYQTWKALLALRARIR